MSGIEELLASKDEKIKKLREALEPFASAFDAYTTDDGSCITSDEYRAMKTSVLPDHFRKARAALEEGNERKPE